MTSAISATDLQVRYDDTIAVDNVNLDVPKGSSLAVIGPNGSGKSTLLAAIAGIVEPAAGSTKLDGPAPALVLQTTNVDKSLPITVRDTVSLARYPKLGLFGRFRSADTEAVDQAMSRLAVHDLADRQLHELSGGQRQRVLVAQGLAQGAEVLMLDEPMTGLDLVSRAAILEIIDEETEAGRTVVMTTHNLDDARRCHQVLLLNTTPIAVGPPTEVLTEQHLRTAFNEQFVSIGGDVVLSQC